MRYWWVNQNQTFRQETEGGYLWSPKRNANGARNPFYEFMREVAPGDLILSFQGTYIRAIGTAQSHAYECPKPAEFGATGRNWERIGWRVDVHYVHLTHQIRPVEHMETLAPLLPTQYSPLQASGRGLQGVYLASVPEPLMQGIVNLIGREAKDMLSMLRVSDIPPERNGLAEWEEHLRAKVERDGTLAETEKRQIVLARRGQGRFKKNVAKLEQRCRITRVDREEHLRASHIRPWRDSDNSARLDGENGLMLTPSIDHLFDRGFISFEDNGRLLISPVAHKRSLLRMGVSVDKEVNAGTFTDGQKNNLDFHRNFVFLETRKR